MSISARVQAGSQISSPSFTTPSGTTTSGLATPVTGLAAASPRPGYEPPQVRVAGNLRELVAQTGSDLDERERQMNEGTR